MLDAAGSNDLEAANWSRPLADARSDLFVDNLEEEKR